MSGLTPLVPGVYQISLGSVNAFVLHHDNDVVLIDTGVPGSADKILSAVRGLGQRPNHILVTHLHTDHAGSLKAIKEATGAPAYMHPLDAEAVRHGIGGRPMKPAPGLFNYILVRIFTARGVETSIDPAPIEHEIQDGDHLAIAGGLKVIHVPGHAAGQVAFLWEHEDGVLFVADAAFHMFGLNYPPGIEDYEAGLQSLRKLSSFDFEVACFGHGNAIIGQADQRFRKKWGADPLH